jgi:hypothetical protein
MIAISLIVCWVLGFYIGYQFRGMLMIFAMTGRCNVIMKVTEPTKVELYCSISADWTQSELKQYFELLIAYELGGLAAEIGGLASYQRAREIASGNLDYFTRDYVDDLRSRILQLIGSVRSE